MPANVELAGFPSVQYMTFFQASDARPGRCVVETTITGDGITTMPRHAALTVASDNFTGSWPDMRVVKAARVGHVRTRMVLEDNRWKMWETTMTSNFNDRDAGGNVLSGSEKSVEDLVTEIAEATGLAITASSTPSLKPPAKWAGRVAGECMADMLRDTGCRMVYSPGTQEYTVISAGHGEADIDPGQGLYQPPPGNRFEQVHFKSDPVLFEDTLNCTAKQINTDTGEAEDIPGGVGLPSSPTQEHGQLRYRLWVPDESTDRVYLDRRAMTSLFDPVSPVRESARIVRDEFERYPHHEPFFRDRGQLVKAIELTGGGKGFVTRNPVLIAEGSGSLKKTCKLVTSYHKVDNDGQLERSSETVNTGGTGGEHTVYIDWIKPVDSTLPDVPASNWDTVLSEASQAMSEMYKGDPRVMYLPEPIDFGGDGRIGAMKYHFRLTSRPMIYAIACINFSPGSLGDLG